MSNLILDFYDIELSRFHNIIHIQHDIYLTNKLYLLNDYPYNISIIYGYYKPV